VFLSPDNVLLAASLEETGSELSVKRIDPFPFRLPDWSIGHGQDRVFTPWDITPDGNLIYVIESLPTPIYALDNWNAKLKT
jgi:hypothetical protein